MDLTIEFDTCTPRIMIDTKDMKKAVVALLSYGMKLEGQNFDVSITVVPKVTITYCSFDDLVECTIQWHPLLAELCGMEEIYTACFCVDGFDQDEIMWRLQQALHDDLRSAAPSKFPLRNQLRQYLLENWTIDEADLELEGDFFDAAETVDSSDLIVEVEINMANGEICFQWPDSVASYLNNPEPIIHFTEEIPDDEGELDTLLRDSFREELQLLCMNADGNVLRILKSMMNAADFGGFVVSYQS